MPAMPDCPPPPPPVKGQNVSFFAVLGGMRTELSGWNVTVGPEGIENLYGTWATFEKGDEYKLRSVDAALEELRQGGRAVPMPMPMPPMPVDDTMPVEPAVGMTAPAPTPAIDMVSRPAIAPYSYPCPPETDCVAPEPQVVSITGVELTLLPNPVYSGRTAPARMYLVPGYRFTGTFPGGEAWETSVIALHPDAIAPPPPVDAHPPGKGIEPATPLPAPDPAPEKGSAG